MAGVEPGIMAGIESEILAEVDPNVPLHAGHGGPGVLAPEWFRAEFLPFLAVFLLLGAPGILLAGALYGYDRLRYDHPRPVGRAFALLWTALYYLVVGVAVGTKWDAGYHARHGFDSFYSAPHLFVYAMAGVATLLVVALATFSPARFGPRSKLPFGVPAPLGLLLLGLVATGVAGTVLDNAWHTAFGLDETPWSFPHAMIGWGLLASALGFAAATTALSRRREASGGAGLVVAYLLLATSVAPVMGPFGKHLTVEHLHAITALPGLRAEAGAQHAFAVLETWHLVRTNPVALVPAAVWGGAAVGFLREYLGRARAVVGVVALFTLLRGMSNRSTARTLGIAVDDPAAWWPLPLLVAVLVVLVGGRAGLEGRSRRLLAGGAFALVTALVWAPTATGLALAVPAAVAFALAHRVGRGAHGVVERPTARRVALVGAVVVAVPFATGLLDLLLRAATRSVTA